MDSPENHENQTSEEKEPRFTVKTRKVVVGIIATLILGAIGSGIWEKMGNPLFNTASRFIIEGINTVFSSYKDSIYKEGSYGFTEGASTFVYQTLLMALPTGYLLLLFKHPKLRSRIAPKEDSKIRLFLISSRGFYLISFLTLIVFTSTLVSFTRTLYVRSVITYVDSTIQRIAPRIDAQAEKELWAQYRSVRNAQDYYAFYDTLQTYLKRFNMRDYGIKPL